MDSHTPLNRKRKLDPEQPQVPSSDPVSATDACPTTTDTPWPPAKRPRVDPPKFTHVMDCNGFEELHYLLHAHSRPLVATGAHNSIRIPPCDSPISRRTLQELDLDAMFRNAQLRAYICHVARFHRSQYTVLYRS